MSVMSMRSIARVSGFFERCLFVSNLLLRGSLAG